jgi:hypothetical protein
MPSRRFEAPLRWLASRFPPSVVRSVRYPREHLFVKGLLDFESDDPSILFFTVKKSASTLMRDVVAWANRRHLRLTHLNLAAYLWDSTDSPVYDYMSVHSAALFRDRGILYAPLRQYVDVSHLRQARIICMLRDPRDVVVSGYFSARYSHRAPASPAKKMAFLEQRQLLDRMSIDEYALGYATRLFPIYEAYRRNLERSKVLTYEEMWYHFDQWAAQLADLLGAHFSAADVAYLRRLADIDRPAGEDVRAHRRKGTPGDYRGKLTADASGRITDMFADTLRWLYG